jgi:hypothetical protein
VSDAESRDADWPLARWGRILDRVELRRAGLGLKFWGPPLWLEVTMTGPDSDRWPANPEEHDSWNWLSTETCFEAERLLVQGADDDQLVVAVGRYTVENLILNAVHEIGEWLRFDGRRVFPAHPSSQGSPAAADGQGNGSVQLTVTFRPPVRPTPAFRARQPVDDVSAQGQLRLLTELAGPSRFTYLPGTAVHYHAAGPVIRLHSNGGSATGWRSMWSTATLDAVRNHAYAETLIGAIQRDVHGALVAWEADRICRAFYIDRRRPWRLSAPEPPLGPEPAADDEEVDDILTLTIAYLDPEDA